MLPAEINRCKRAQCICLRGDWYGLVRTGMQKAGERTVVRAAIWGLGGLPDRGGSGGPAPRVRSAAGEIFYRTTTKLHTNYIQMVCRTGLPDRPRDPRDGLAGPPKIYRTACRTGGGPLVRKAKSQPCDNVTDGDLSANTQYSVPRRNALSAQLQLRRLSRTPGRQRAVV